jgi:hypothetical protein
MSKFKLEIFYLIISMSGFIVIKQLKKILPT